MNISIFGLGYVGAVCCGSLAARGHNVIGVDVSEAKIRLMNDGRSPIVEPGLNESLEQAVKNGKFEATDDAAYAIANSDLTMICVGTPSKANGDLDLTYIEGVCKTIGEVLANKATWHTVVIRSTVLPGTVSNTVQPIIEKYSHKKAGEGFGLAVNPEFLREGTAINDYEHPPMTVIGEYNERSGDVLAEIYSDLPAQTIRKPIEVAEMIKYTCNVWHAVKITFANEIGNIAKACGVDGREVMEVVCEDSKLNISSYYMRPGFAFGGSCLPKDVRALSSKANQLDVKHPLINAIMESNQRQVEKAYKIISSFQKKNVAMLGLSFKAGTDDLRESPLVTLAELLIGKGYNLKIYDENVGYARQHGANADYINNQIPHVSSLLTSDLDSTLQDADIVVMGNQDEEFKKILEKIEEEKHILDLVGFMDSKSVGARHGICW